MFEGVGGGGVGGRGKRVFDSFRSRRCRGLLYAWCKSSVFSKERLVYLRSLLLYFISYTSFGISWEMFVSYIAFVQ